MRTIIVLVFVLLSFWVRTYSLSIKIPYIIGMLLLLGTYLGEIAAKLKLPKISGYLIGGLLLGQIFIKLIDQPALEGLEIVRSLALVVIAMTAGFEFNLKFLKKELKHIFALSVLTFLGVFLGIFFTAYLFFRFQLVIKAPEEYSLLLAAIIAIISTAKSPLSTIALIEETGIKNRFSSVILGATIFKDIILIFVFVGLVFLLARVGASTDAVSIWMPAYELLGSIAIGGVFGVLFHFYFRFVNTRNTMFLILIAFVIGEISSLLHLSPLLFGMTVGFVVGNYSRQRKKLEKSLAEASAVILILFFSLNGAWIRKSWLTRFWILSAIFTSFRVLFLYISVRISEAMVGHSRSIKKYGWTGFINQSGISLAIALLIQQGFPALGETVYPVALGMIVITDFVSLPMFKWALLKSKNEED